MTGQPDQSGEFAPPVYGSLGRTLLAVQATVVGNRLVVFDAASGTLVVPGGISRSLNTNDPHAVLQLPGPTSSAVLLATTKVLLSVDLDSGDATTLWSSGNGIPAAPARLGDCIHAAWANTANGYVRSCNAAPVQPGNLSNANALIHPEFRINRGAIVLNDLASGAVWDLSTLHEVDDWAAVRPPPVRKPSKNNKHDKSTALARDLPPKATDDTLGARPSRTTLLHVLDNDSDPGGQILSIQHVDQPDNSKAHTAISPDGQTVAVTVPAQSPELHFRYVIDDGTGHTSSAAVTVQIRTPGENRQPNRRTGARQPAFTVAAGGRLSLPVLSDWRDFDGDPVVLASAATKLGTATATADGFVNFIAPVKGGPVSVSYQVSDGVGVPVAGSVSVMVQSPQSTTAIAATTEPDVARGEVGQPILVHPLDNDLPGSDPSDPAAQVVLAADVASPSGTTVGTDLHTGAVTVTASRAGTYLLDYRAEFGNAPFAKGTIRVDVAPDPATPASPVAMPDSAILHGQVPATVDVLDNDYDPAGHVLVVQQAAAVGSGAQVSVAILAGHWLRISALAPIISPNPQIVRYTITDGVTGPVTGEVSVTQVAPPTDDRPVPVDDYATVRAADTVTVPVLDNDTDTSGAPLSLVSNLPGAPGPGRLTVTPSIGAAYVDGNRVRYVPPARVAVAEPVSVDYVVQDPAGDQSRGQVHLTIEPAPSATDPNRAPEPPDVTDRVVAGDTAIVSVPTTGVDPDGDSVAVSGLSSAPTLGRVLSMNATSLTYQAYPMSAGTDSFSYRVVDRFGGVGTATVQIAVAPPGDPQPPVAVDDTVTAAPGAHVAIDVVANDLFAPDDTVTVEPLRMRNTRLAAGTALVSSAGPIDVRAPAASGRPLVLAYSVTDGIGAPSTATVTVRAQTGYDEPPVSRDAYAQRAGNRGTASVNVLSGSTDPDGTPGDLSVARVFDARAHVSGDGTVTAPVSAMPYAIAYEIVDPGGATAIGVVHVPGAGAGGPYARGGQVISVPRTGSTSAQIASYVIDPAGKPVRLTTTDQISASPSNGLQVRARGTGVLVLSAKGGYVGPGAVTFQVTDGASLTDPAGRTALITVPVQVGPDTPVIRCPTDPLDVVEGGATVTVNVTAICHVWTAEPARLAGLRYLATWQRRPTNVSLTGSGTHTLALTAGGAAVPGSSGTISIGVVGTQASAEIAVRIHAAAPPSVAPITVDGVKAGQTATVDMSAYVRSQLRDPAISVIGADQSTGASAAVQTSGAVVRITPSKGAHGTMTFRVVVTDTPGAARPDRQATGQITLHVLGVPDAPGTPVVGRTVLSTSVALAWSTPANNGAPITSYTVSYAGGSQKCAASPCLITGLHNGTSYRFRVRATNLVGPSKLSGTSGPAVPDTVPTAVTNLVASHPQNGTLQLSWTRPHFNGTAVKRYDVTWPGGGHASVSGNGLTATGLSNDTIYTFRVIAVNALGPGPAATVTGQSAGAPRAPATPRFTWANSADSSTRAVRVSWSADDPNGPGPTTYTLQRSGGGTVTVCSHVTATSCTDDGIGNDGTIYTYRVTAANADAATDAAAHTSPLSPGATMTAAATPSPIRNFSATATGQDGRATLHFDAPRSNGASSTVTCTRNGSNCGTWTFPTGGRSGVTETVSGLPNGITSTLSLVDCNGSSGAGAGNPCDGSVSANVTAYGPMKNLVISTSASGQTVNFTVSVDPNGKAANVTVRTSKRTQSFSTGVGQWSWSSSDTMGYSKTDTISVTVSSPGRTSLSKSKSQTTPAAPPPTVSITASQGANGVGTVGDCTDASVCHWLDFQVHNFPTGSYAWSCISNGSVSYTSGSYRISITSPNQTFTDRHFCIFGRGITEAIRIDGYTSNGVPHQ